MYFHYFVIISPWKRAGPFIWTNLNPLHPMMLCAKFGWNWPSGSGEEDENVKSLRRQRQQRQRQRRRRQRRTTDKFWSEKLTWAFGSGELKKLSAKRRTKKLNMRNWLETSWGWIAYHLYIYISVVMLFLIKTICDKMDKCISGIF